MNRGLLLKSLHEVWVISGLFAVALMIVEALLGYVLPTFAEQFSTIWLDLPFVKNMLRALLGVDVGEQIGPEVFASIAWVHPVVLTIIAAHATIFATRVPVGEIDRATIDVLLGLPVSRWGLYRAELAMFLASGVFLIAMALVGNRIGSLLVATPMPFQAKSTLIMIVNLFCLYIAAGGLAWLVSSLSERRGKAIAIVFSILLASFLLSFLAEFWKPADTISFLSILTYYQPLIVIRQEQWPLGDMAVLLILGTVMWTAGGICFARRDICTV